MLDLDKETFITVRYMGEELECYVGDIMQDRSIGKDRGMYVTKFNLISMPRPIKKVPAETGDML